MGSRDKLSPTAPAVGKSRRGALVSRLHPGFTYVPNADAVMPSALRSRGLLPVTCALQSDAT
jgi:hypothetical protein